MSLANVKPRPKEPAEPQIQQATPQPEAKEEAFSVSDADLGTDALDAFWEDERETPNVGGNTTDPEEAPKKKKGFFENLFSKPEEETEDTDEPDLSQVEFSDEMYDFTAEAATEITDMFFSNANDKLHATDDPTKWQATDPERIKVQKAWKYYVKAKQMVMSPGWYLLFTIFIIYGLGTLFGMIAYFNRIRVYGWHWPWSDSWKQKQNSMQWTGPKTNAASNATAERSEHISSSESTEKSAPEPKNEAKPQAPPVPRKDAEQPRNLEMKKCPITGQNFKAGTGYPRTGKLVDQYPELKDKFATRSAWATYGNQTGLFGGRAHEARKQSDS